MEEISKYEKYKDTGIEWIGEIPENWDVKKIKHRCYVKGRVGWKGLKSSEFLTDGFSYLVTGTDFKNDTVDWDNCYHIDEERYSEDPYIQLQNEDLLITKDGTIGKLAVVTNLDKPACLNSGIFVVRSTKDDFSTRFLLWVLKSSTFTDFNGLTAYGSTIQHLYQNVFVEFAFAFPPVNTQISIADFLRKKTTEIDQIIANKQKLIALYEEEKQAIINQAVTKGLDPNVKMKDSGVEWLGQIPEHWKVSRLKNICSVRQGLQIPITERHFSQIEDSFEYITIKSINNPDDTKEHILNPSGRVICEIDDILVARTGATGEIITNVHGVFHNNFFLVDYNRSKVDRLFLIYFLKSKKIKSYLLLMAGTTTIPDLNHNAFYNTPFFEFSLNEQQTIVSYIVEEINRLDCIIDKFKKQIDLLQEYRTTLISEVVTGRIKVPNTIEA